ncbi:MAG: UxaA family hydrolase [Alphaproteobacteria bacterium]
MPPSSGFLGYRRPDGRAGTRNHVLVLSILGLVGGAARRIARDVRGTLLVATPYGRGQFGDDKLVHERQLVGLARNPNVAAVLVVGADRKAADRVAAAVATTGKPVEVAALDDVPEDSLALGELGTRRAAVLVRDASRLRREACPASARVRGVVGGHSDATSGLGANPLAGAAVDRVVDAGGTAVFGETVEWFGAEQLLARRGATPAVGEAIVAAVMRREAAVAATGFDLTGNNPGQENIRGGLSTIEEKSLGAIAKGGTRPIQGVLAIAEEPGRPGLYVMDAPAFSPESLTGFAASGANLMLFTTGAGNSFCNAIAPTLKISVRPDTVARLPHQIDFDGSAILAGAEEIDAAGARLFERILAVASGERSWGEILDEGDETFIRVGGSL